MIGSLVSVIVVLFILFIWLKPIYIVGFGGTLKIPVPLEIRISRDCDKYAEFVKSIMGPMFLPNPRNGFDMEFWTHPPITQLSPSEPHWD